MSESYGVVVEETYKNTYGIGISRSEQSSYGSIISRINKPIFEITSVDTTISASPSSSISINVTINNNGEISGDFEIRLRDHNGSVVASTTGTLDSGNSTTLTLNATSPDKEGTYLWKIELYNKYRSCYDDEVYINIDVSDKDTISTKNIRDYESSSTGSTYIKMTYNKNDSGISTLSLVLKDLEGNIIDSKDIDVSSVSEGSSTDIAETLSNNLEKITIPSSIVKSVTVPANSSVTYTSPYRKFSIIMAGDSNIEVSEIGESRNIMIPPNMSVTLVNNGSSDVTVTIYEIDSKLVDVYHFMLEIDEKDSAGNVKYSKTLIIWDTAPMTV